MAPDRRAREHLLPTVCWLSVYLALAAAVPVPAPARSPDKWASTGGYPAVRRLASRFGFPDVDRHPALHRRADNLSTPSRSAPTAPRLTLLTRVTRRQ